MTGSTRCVCLKQRQKQVESKTKCFRFTSSPVLTLFLYVTVQLMSSLLLTYDEMISLWFIYSLIATTPDLPRDWVFLDRVSGSIALKDY